MKSQTKARLAATVFALITVQIASAADLPIKAPAILAPALAGSLNWSGFYVGGNIGYGWGRFDSDTTLGGVPIPSSDANLNGVIGGGQFGYNWQAGNLVVGLEGDLQWSGQTGHGTSSFGFLVPPLVTITQPYVSNLDYFGTVRGRLGYAADRWLLYVTGGWAFGHETVNVLDTALTGTAFVNYSAVRNGWTAGSGVEYAINSNWSWKAEYLYIDLGNWAITNPTALVTTVSTTKFTDNIFRVGANYRFGASATASDMPVHAHIYKALPGIVARPWAGLYAGVNAGWGWSHDAGGDLSGDSLPTGAQQCIAFGFCSSRIGVKYDGFTGGAQAGYNWQWDSLVVGVEADINYADWAGSTIAPRLLPGPGFTSITLSQKVDAFATVRGRFGFTPTDWTLVYVTGGFAFGHTKTGSVIPSTNQPTFTGSDSSWNTGWTFGGGVEQKLSMNWSAKLEALYYDLNNTLAFATNASPFFGTFDTAYRGYILRTGLNYKLN